MWNGHFPGCKPCHLRIAVAAQRLCVLTLGMEALQAERLLVKNRFRCRLLTFDMDRRRETLVGEKCGADLFLVPVNGDPEPVNLFLANPSPSALAMGIRRSGWGNRTGASIAKNLCPRNV